MDRNSQGSWEFYTPKPFVEAVRETMGGIDLDPASCDAAQTVVQAAVYLTAEDDGLSCVEHWSGKVFTNPPGGVSPEVWAKISRSYQAVWWYIVGVRHHRASLFPFVQRGIAIRRPTHGLPAAAGFPVHSSRWADCL